MKAKGDYLDQVHSDQMILGIGRQEAGPHERWLRATQGGAIRL
jgi:hypothetical protein